MSHDHGSGAHHHHLHHAGARHAPRLRLAFALTVGMLVAEVVVALVTNSLAVASDAGHLATDALGLGLALAAIGAASRARQARHHTFGLYRLEILAALTNAVLLVAVAAYVLYEAVHRWNHPPHVGAWAVLAIGIVGLAVNVTAFFLLRGGQAESLNVRGAYLEVVADLVGSVGVVVGAVVLAATGWHRVDPLVGAGIGVFILPRAYRLGRDAVRVLLQAAPHGLDIDDVRHALAALPGVTDVHDLHVWTLTSEMDVVTAHVAVGHGTAPQPVLDAARDLLAVRFGLTHATLQVEAADQMCEEMTW